MVAHIEGVVEKVEQENALLRIPLQDEVRHMRAQIDDLQLRLADAQFQSYRAEAHVTNWLAERVFGKPIHPDVDSPTLPEAPPDAELVSAIPRKRQARQIVQTLERQFLDTYEQVTYGNSSGN